MSSVAKILVSSVVATTILSPGLRASIVADPISIDFGDVALVRFGDEAGLLRFFVAAPVTIMNNGTTPVTIAVVEVSGSPHFELMKHRCDSLPPGGACPALVRYAPRAAGGHAGALTVRASDGEELVVPLWGDAEEVACSGSICDGLPLSFGAATPGQVRSRILGFANDSTGSVFAGVALSGAECFAADIPESALVDPGAEYSLGIACTYSGTPGFRRGACTFDVPPPMLPVVRSVQIPLVALVLSEIRAIASIPLGAREMAIGRGMPFRAMERHRKSEAGVSRKIILPTMSGGRAAVETSLVRYRDVAGMPELSAWRKADIADSISPGEELMSLTSLLASRKKKEAEEFALGKRLKGCALLVGRRDALLMDPPGSDVAREGPLSGGLSYTGLLVPSELWQSRAYAIRMKRTGPRVGAAPCLASIRAKREEALQVYLPARCKELAEIVGERPKSVRAMDCVAVRAADGSWEEKLVMVARFPDPSGTGTEDEQRLLLLGKRGRYLDARVTLSPRYGEVSMVRAAAYRKIAAASAAHRKIACYLGRQGGRLLRYQASRGGLTEDRWDWQNNPLRVKLPEEKLLSMRKIGPGEVDGRRPHDHIGQFLVVGRRALYILDGSESMMRRVASARANGIVLAASRPRHTLEGEEQPVYLLEKRKDGGRTVVNGYRIPRIPGPDGKKKNQPVALTGDCEIELEVPKGATQGSVKLEAHVFDPDGAALHYSWTAPGIEFDDPTSATPTGLFPLGETVVYLVVRDGPADDAETLESEPCIVRVTVKEQTGAVVCGDSNGDGGVNIGDAISVLSYLFAHGPEPTPLAKADVNGSGEVNIADAIYLLSYLFAKGPAPRCSL